MNIFLLVVTPTAFYPFLLSVSLFFLFVCFLLLFFFCFFVFSVRSFVLISVPDLLVSSSSKADLQMITSTSSNRGIRFDTEILLTW